MALRDVLGADSLGQGRVSGTRRQDLPPRVDRPSGESSARRVIPCQASVPPEEGNLEVSLDR
jgi:hypothetical protein